MAKMQLTISHEGFYPHIDFTKDSVVYKDLDIFDNLCKIRSGTVIPIVRKGGLAQGDQSMYYLLNDRGLLCLYVSDMENHRMQPLGNIKLSTLLNGGSGASAWYNLFGCISGYLTILKMSDKNDTRDYKICSITEDAWELDKTGHYKIRNAKVIADKSLYTAWYHLLTQSPNKYGLRVAICTMSGRCLAVI